MAGATHVGAVDTVTPALAREALLHHADLAYHGPHHPFVVGSAAHRLALHHEAPAVNLDLVDAGVLLHDAGYVPGRSGNEAIAAAIAHEVLTAHGWSLPGINRVGRIIRDTEDHQPYPENLESCLVSDADLSGFWGPPDRFDADDDAVRTEFLDAGVAPDLFELKRTALLGSALAAALEGRLFHFPVDLEARHGAAIANITRALHR